MPFFLIPFMEINLSLVQSIKKKKIYLIIETSESVLPCGQKHPFAGHSNPVRHVTYIMKIEILPVVSISTWKSSVKPYQQCAFIWRLRCRGSYVG